MTNRTDVLIGGGHNGLVTAGYLARAGLSVTVLEQRHLVGGACVTEEVWPGYKVSTLSYLCSLLSPRVIQDLELKKHGFHIYPKDPPFFTVYPDGRHLFFWQDDAKTHAELAHFSPKDADAYPAYTRKLVRLAEWAESMFLTTPPNLLNKTLGDWMALGRLGLTLLKLSEKDRVELTKIMTQSVKAYLDEHFESDEIKATLATDGVIGANGGPSTPGTAYNMLHHVMGGATGLRGVWGFVKGGMGGISESLASSARAHKAVIRTGVKVERILVRESRATGAVLAGGEEIQARFVVSNAHPQTTFLKLLDSRDLDPEFRTSVERLPSKGSSFKINLALSGPPQFTAYPTNGLGPQHRATMHICPSMKYMDEAWNDAASGRPSSQPIIECTMPSAYDDTLAPKGQHLMGLFVQYAPFDLKEGTWDTEKEKFTDRCIDTLATFAPNIKSLILHRQAISPLDMEREYGMLGGSLFHGDMTPDRLFFMRPLPGWARYRTPVKGLYLCGSGTHPGGGVTGMPGFNAAREILKDWRRKRGRGGDPA